MNPMRFATLASLAACCASLAADPGSDTKHWFPLAGDGKGGPTVIGMESWLDGPAGTEGAIVMQGDRTVHSVSGREAKFWGVNLGGSDCVPTPEQGEYWAERFARFGVNAVRLHKPWSDLYEDDDSTRLKPEALARLDAFVAALKRRGIHVTWSFFYHRRLGAKDLERLRWPDDLLNPEGKRGNIYGVVDYVPEIQDILIEATTNLLEHVNPHTGLRYADEPALAGIEFQNEASIMFWSERGLSSMPNYASDVAARFSAWLRARHGSHEALVQAWGAEALDRRGVTGEHLDLGNIAVVSEPQLYSTDGFARLREQGLFRRISETAEFLHELQNEFYDRFAARVRRTGYVGPLIGSCWRGQGDVSEYYNLRSDARIGVIDRHNYFGGLSGWRPRAEPFASKAQVNTPGGGLLCSGMVQVADRPFWFSEWATVFPNEYVAESPALVAVYGMGLQGWDASFQFASSTSGRGYAETLHGRNHLWAIDRLENIGLYPALSRLVLRGDVAEGPVISTRRVSLDDLRAGALPWGPESYRGWRDVKTYVGPMPGSSLAAGRVVVEIDGPRSGSDMPDLSAHVSGGVVRSATGQLAWDTSREGRGFFTVDTPGTRAVVGFSPDGPVALGDVAIEVASPGFAAVFVTALDRDADLRSTRSALVTTIARTANTGMAFSEARDALLALGEAPVLVEPVLARLRLDGRPVLAVHVLDHDGRRSGRTVAQDGGVITLDGATTRAFWYEIEFEPAASPSPAP